MEKMSEKRILQLALKGLEIEYIRVNTELVEITNEIHKIEEAEKDKSKKGDKISESSTKDNIRKRLKKKRRMSDAQKKALSKTMKALWARKKKTKNVK